MEFKLIIVFVIGFSAGGLLIWFLKRKQIESVLDTREQLQTAFGDLSNQALIDNQKNFLDLAEDKFSTILGKSDDQLSKKKELIDLTLKTTIYCYIYATLS